MPKYLVAFANSDCTTVEADGWEIRHGGVLLFYNFPKRKSGLYPPPPRAVKAFKEWRTVETEE